MINWRTDIENAPQNTEILLWAMSCDGFERPYVAIWSEHIYNDCAYWIMTDQHDFEVKNPTRWAEFNTPDQPDALRTNLQNFFEFCAWASSFYSEKCAELPDTDPLKNTYNENFMDYSEQAIQMRYFLDTDYVLPTKTKEEIYREKEELINGQLQKR